MKVYIVHVHTTVLATEIRSPERWVHILAVSGSEFHHPVLGLCDVSALLRGRISFASTVVAYNHAHVLCM